VAGALILALLVVLLGSNLPVGTRRVISDLGLIGGGLFGSLACAHRRVQFTGRRRRAWSFFALGATFTVVSNLSILVIHVAHKPDWWTVYSAPAFLIALFCGLIGLSLFSASPRRITDIARMTFDCAVISGSLFLLSVVAFPAVLAARGDHPLVLLLPLVDVAVATYAFLIFSRVGHADRLVLGVLCAGSAAYAVFDFSFIVITAQRPGFGYGTPLDVGWMLGYLLVGLAALHPAASRPPSSEAPKELSPALGTIAMFVLVLLATAGSLWSRASGAWPFLLSLLWLTIVVSVGARQLMLIVDNDRLRNNLELMVADRTLELGHAIRQSELLLTSVGEGIYGVDPDGLITFVNPAGALTLGYSPEELVGRDAHDTFHSLRDDGTPYPVESCYITQAISAGTVTNTEEDSYVRPDGRVFPVEVTATPMTGEGSVRGAVRWTG
jgi:PAS domain S-box-containing protein